MIERLRELAPWGDQEEDEEPEEQEERIPALRILAAQLLLATGAGVAMQRMQGSGDDLIGLDEEIELSRATRSRTSLAVWAPLVLAPLAAAAQLTHALRPSEGTRTATRVLNAAVVGVGAAELVDSLLASRSGEQPSAAPWVFGSVGVLGWLLDRQEDEMREEREEREALERRAAIVERLVPRRRPKLDRIVVHV